MDTNEDLTKLPAEKAVNTFASLYSGSYVAQRPKFDTSLHSRSPQALSSSSTSGSDINGTLSQQNLNHESSSNHKKRSSHSIDDSAEDILEQICSQMNTLSTQDSNNDKIVAFMSVLACPHVEAAFFLESADWSVEAAVTLWLESGIGTALGDGHKRSRSILPQDDSGHSYSHKQIFIQGLPEDWSAWVSAVSGHIYFTHNESGHRQSNVPPGFADCMHSRDDGVCKISDMMTQDEGESDEGMRNRDRYSNSTAHGSRDEDSEGANDDFSVTETFDNNAFSGIVEMAGGGPSPVTDDKGQEPSDSSQSAIFTDTNDIDNGNTSSSSDISGGGSNDSRRMF